MHLCRNRQKNVWHRSGRQSVFLIWKHRFRIAQLRDKKEVSELTDECDRFCKYASRIIAAVVTVGIGQVCDRVSELSKSYSGAREAVSYRVLYGASRAINMNEIAPKEGAEPDSTSEAELSIFLRRFV